MSSAIRSGGRKIEQLFDVLEHWTLMIGFIALAAMMVLVTVNAVGRYIINQPISGAYEITELYLMPMTIFLTAGHLQNEGGNINVDLVFDRFPDSMQVGIHVVGRVIALVIFALIAHRVGLRAYNGFLAGQSTVGVISLPVWLSWLIMFFGLAIFSVRVIIQLRYDVASLYGAARRSIGTLGS